MNKIEILVWAILISFFTAAICGALVLWWFTRKEAIEE
ncbi:putative phage replication protein [Acinetobacter seifertii]